MENLPFFIPFSFILVVGICLWFLYRASKQSGFVLGMAVLWLGLQSFLSLRGFYTVTDTLPPRMLLLILPPFLLIIYLFSRPAGRNWVDSLDTKWLTLLHLVRVPVELILFGLFLNQAVPELMTFSGRNYDILSGLTAPLIFYFGYVKKDLPNWAMAGWNVICLGLLFNIVFHGILSVPTPFQQFGWEQPNVALLYFPFAGLPGFIVPLVLFSHLASLRALFRRNRSVPAAAALEPGLRGI